MDLSWIVEAYGSLAVVMALFTWLWILRNYDNYRWYVIAFGGLLLAFQILHFVLHFIHVNQTTHFVPETNWVQLFAHGMPNENVWVDIVHFVFDDTVIMIAAWLNALHTKCNAVFKGGE